MSEDIARANRFALLAALLDHETPPWRPGEMPPLGHWLLFPPEARQSELGIDGHPRRRDDGLPRRMWAGSRVAFLRPVRFEAHLTQAIETLSSVEKHGRSGTMRFETLRKRIWCDGEVAIEEEQDLVYRAAPPAGASAHPTPPEERMPIPPVIRRASADATMLFRFSALTYNAHRIHYDRSYATEVEGYPGLVVHGPLLATLLMDHHLRHNAGSVPGRFSFRAMRPVFDGEDFTLGANGGALSVIDASGGLAMSATVEF